MNQRESSFDQAAAFCVPSEFCNFFLLNNPLTVSSRRDRQESHRVVAENIDGFYGDRVAAGVSIGVAGGEELEARTERAWKLCHLF